MKQNSVQDMLVKNLFRFIFVALVFSLFNISAQAATLLLPAGSNVNDVAADSISGTVYITKTDGTLHSSANGLNYVQILGPDQYSSYLCSYQFQLKSRAVTFKANRITVDSTGTLWVVMTKNIKETFCFSPIINNTTTNVLYRLVGSTWIERQNSPNPVDVGVSPGSFFQSGTVFVTSTNSPNDVLNTGDQIGNSSFFSTGASGFARVDAKTVNSAWAVGYNETLWSYTGNVIPPGRPWINSGQANVKDVTVNKLTGRVYISKTQQAGGTIWYSDNNGASFQQEPATGFQNLAVTSNGVLYGAGYNGSLWRF